MSEKVYIQDDFGNQISLLDDYGNLSMQVIMLYTEDKLRAEHRKVVDDFVATDEMSRDALEGYAQTSNASRTRHIVNELNASIQKKSGARTISPLIPKKENNFDFQKLAAAAVLLILIGSATFLVSRVWNKSQLASSEPKPQKVQNSRIEPVEAKALPEIRDSLPIQKSAKDKTQVQEVVKDESFLLKSEDKQHAEPKKAVVSEKIVEITEDELIEPEIAMEDASPQVDQPEDEEQLAKMNYSLDQSGADEDERVADGKLDEPQLNKDQNRLNQNKAKESPQQIEEPRGLTAGEEAVQVSKVAESSGAEYEIVSDVAEQVPIEAAKSKTARYPGGDIKMYQFIERKKNYPNALKEQGISGTVTISFDVDAEGRVSNAKVKKSLSGVLDEDALRVVRSMPKWDSAIENGIAVKSSRSVVIKYGD